MRQILSVGKSIKLIRYLESIFIKEEYANKEEQIENLKEMFKRTQGIDFEKDLEENVSCP